MTMQHFSRAHIQQHFNHAAVSYDEAAVLQREVAAHLDERLDLITLAPKTILDVGAGTGILTEKLVERYPKAQVLALDLSIQMLQRAHTHLTRPKWPALPKALTDTFNLTRPGATCLNGDAAQLPLADDSVDLITTNLMLQWCDDLDAVFQEFRRVLRPEGLLMLTTFGPDTLKELRQAWSEVDETPHVNTFIDMHDIGDALIRNGFGQPVMDVEHFTLTYSKPMGVLRDLKAIGATNATEGRQHGLMGKQRFTRMLEAYEGFRRNGVVPATYEVIHGHAWAAQEVVKGPNRSRDGLVEISLDEFAKQARQR